MNTSGIQSIAVKVSGSNSALLDDADGLQGKAQNVGNSETIVKFCNSAMQPRCVSGSRVEVLSRLSILTKARRAAIITPNFDLICRCLDGLIFCGVRQARCRLSLEVMFASSGRSISPFQAA